MKLGIHHATSRLGSSFARIVWSGGTAPPPVFTVDPVVSGLTTPGATLTRTLGTASGATLSGQWVKNGAPTGITTSTYADTVDGDEVYWAGVATNSAGTDTANSNVVSVATAFSLRFTATDVSATETGFRVETRIDGDTTWNIDATLPALTGTDLTIDETLTLYAPNTLYNWRIVAFSGAGDSDVYGPYSIYTRPSIAPSGLTATPVSSSQINLAWTAGNPVTGYRIYAVEAGGTLLPVGTVSAATLTYNLTGRAASESYDIAVVGYNDNSANGTADAETAKDAAGAFATATALPAIESITVEQSVTTVVFSEAITVGDDTNMPTLTLSGGAITLSTPTGSGTNTWVYTNSRDVGFSETGTGAYTQAGDGLQASDGRLLATFTGRAVVNASDFGAITYLSGVSLVGDTTAGSAIDTTGADLIVFAVCGQFVFGGGTDSEGNTWTALEQSGGGALLKVFYCINPTTDAAHTFSQSSAAYNAIAVMAFSGITGFDKATGLFTAASPSSVQPGSQTPASAPCLSIVAVGAGNNATGFASSGYTLGPNTPAVTGTNYGVGMLYSILPTTAANNPSVTLAASSEIIYIENAIFN